MGERLEIYIERARSLDSTKRIMGSFFIESPVHTPWQLPAKLADQLVGVELPIRLPVTLRSHFAWIDRPDFSASLLIQHRQALLDWVETHIVNTGEINTSPDFMFNTDAGRDVLDSPVQTDAYYNYLARKNRL